MVQSSITMGKLKNNKLGNLPLDANYWQDEYLDDDYHFNKWKRNKKRKNQEGYYDDADMD